MPFFTKANFFCFIWSLIGITFTTMPVYAQPLLQLLSNDSVYSALCIHGDYYTASNAITSKFASAYATHKFINADTKQAVNDQLGAKNKMAYHLQTGVTYVHKKNNWGWIAQFQDEAHSASYFGEDIFRLYFGGNAQFKGTTASLHNFYFSSVVFQRLGAGLLYHGNTNTANWQFAILPSLVKGQLAYNANSSGELYTSSIADSLYLNMNIIANFSDTAKRNFSAWNGTGVTTDIYFRYGKEKKWQASVSLTNLGNVSWSNKSVQLSADTSYSYTGIEISNILDTISLQISGTEDYKNKLLHYKQRNFTSTLPGVIDIRVQKSFVDDNLHLGIGFRSVNDKVATPQFYFTCDYKLSSHINIGINLYNGGYKPFSAALAARLSYGKLFIAPSVSYFEEIFRGNKGTATGASVIAGWQF